MSHGLIAAQHTLLMLLKDAAEGKRLRDKWADAVADGREVLSERDREQVAEYQRRITTELGRLGAVVKVVREVEGTRTGTVPETLRDAYELLWIRAYGSGALYSGDGNAEKVGSASAGWVVKSDGKRHRGPASAKGRGSVGAARRNVILNQAAYELKRKLDKRLWRVTQEIKDFLAGLEGGTLRVTLCPSCGKVGEEDWRYCPRCGDRMNEPEEK